MSLHAPGWGRTQHRAAGVVSWRLISPQHREDDQHCTSRWPGGMRRYLWYYGKMEKESVDRSGLTTSHERSVCAVRRLGMFL